MSARTQEAPNCARPTRADVRSSPLTTTRSATSTPLLLRRRQLDNVVRLLRCAVHRRPVCWLGHHRLESRRKLHILIDRCWCRRLKSGCGVRWRSARGKRHVPSRHVQDPVRVDVESDFNLRRDTWHWRGPIEIEFPKRIVVLRSSHAPL